MTLIKKYWHLGVFVLLCIISVVLWYFLYFKDIIDTYIRFSDIYTDYKIRIFRLIIDLLFCSLYLGFIFLAVYFGIRCKKLSKMVKFDSKEEYEKAIKEQKLEKLREKQEKLEAERKKLEE